MKQRIFSASDQTSSDPTKKSEAASIALNKLFVNWYLKTGLFCRMDYNTFMEQPYKATKLITEELDRRIENWEDDILDYNHLALLMFGAKLFGGKS